MAASLPSSTSTYNSSASRIRPALATVVATLPVSQSAASTPPVVYPTRETSPSTRLYTLPPSSSSAKDPSSSSTTSGARPKHSVSPSPGRIGNRPAFRWTSVDAQVSPLRAEAARYHVFVEPPPPSQLQAQPSSMMTSSSRYEASMPLSLSCEKSAYPLEKDAKRTQRPPSRSPSPVPKVISVRGPSSASHSASSSHSSTYKSSIDEKAILFQEAGACVSDPLTDGVLHHVVLPSSPSSTMPSRLPHTHNHTHPCHHHPSHLPIPHQRHYGQRIKSPSVLRECCASTMLHPRVKPWLPMCAWFATTIGFFIAIAFWRTELFQGLDDLSRYLKEEGWHGQGMLFAMILITTFPPLPLYSTLMMLAGYTYGATTGFYISYFSSLIGAALVFLIFRHLIPTSITTSLLPPSLKRVVRAIEQRPSIFLLVRVAPYPYNVLNAVLGSSSSMPLSRYLGTTALSLLKVIAHTSLGSEIRSFKHLHSHQGEDADGDGEWSWGEIWTVFGIVLCVGLFIYLSFVAQRAVDEETADELEAGTAPGGYTALPTNASSVSVSVALGLGLQMDEQSDLPRLASPNPFPPHATIPPTPSVEPFPFARIGTQQSSSP